MKYMLAACIVLFMSCAPTPKRDSKVDVILRNNSNHPIKIRAGSGIFQREIRIEPGKEWNGWIDRTWLGNNFTVVVDDP